MAFRLDLFKCTVEGYDEDVGRITFDFTLPTDHPLVPQLLQWNREEAIREIQAKGPGAITFL